MDEAHVFGVRDAHGFRPLVLGRTEGGWVLASETAALDIVGAHFVRDVEPGEMVVIDATRRAVDPVRGADAEALPVRVRLHRASRHVALRAAACTRARQRMGEELARQAPASTPTW